MEAGSELSEGEVDDIASAAVRRGLHDLRHGLKLELERLEAILAIPQYGREDAEDQQKLKCGLTDIVDAVEQVPGLHTADRESNTPGRLGKRAVTSSGGPKTATTAPCRGLPCAPTEAPPAPNAGEKPEPPPAFQIIITQVPEPPEPDSRPSTPSAMEFDSTANTLPSVEEALSVKTPTQGFQSVVTESPSPALQQLDRTPKMPDFTESAEAALQQGGGGAGTPGSAGAPRGAGTGGASTPLQQDLRAANTPASEEGSGANRKRAQSAPQSFMGRTITKLKSLPNKSTQGNDLHKQGLAISGELAHYKRTYDMEKKKMELISRTPSRAAEVPMQPTNRLKECVRHTYFEAFFVTAILCSAFVYGAEVQYNAHHPYEIQPIGFFVLHQLFTVVFLIELFMRMYAVGAWKFLCTREHLLWGWLDVTVCLASLLESVLGTLLLTMDGDHVSDADPVRIVRMLRVLRMSRAFRLQRIMQFVSSLRTLVYSIAATLKSLFWAMVLLLTIIFVFAMCFTQFTTDYSIDPHGDAEVVEEMKLYWGSLDRSMLTLFQSIAGGISWREAALPMQEVSFFILFLFVLYIAFVYFAVLNVVTGVFCSSAIDQTQRTPELIARSLIDNKHVYETELRKLFGKIDSGNTGLITLSEFESLQDDELTLAYFKALEINFADAWSIFKLIDEDKGGAIEIDEFVRGCQQLRGGASSLEIQELAFDLHKLSEALHKGLQETSKALERLRADIQVVGGRGSTVTTGLAMATLA